MNVFLELDGAFQAESRRGLATVTKCYSYLLWNKHRQAVPKSPNDECVFGRCGCSFPGLQAPSFEGQSHVELDTGSTGHLCEPMTSVYHGKRALDMRFGLQRRVQRCVTNRSGELSMGEDIGISSDRRLGTIS